VGRKVVKLIRGDNKTVRVWKLSIKKCSSKLPLKTNQELKQSTPHQDKHRKFSG
jgi:hypothetical protein